MFSFRLSSDKFCSLMFSDRPARNQMPNTNSFTTYDRCWPELARTQWPALPSATRSTRISVTSQSAITHERPQSAITQTRQLLSQKSNVKCSRRLHSATHIYPKQAAHANSFRGWGHLVPCPYLTNTLHHVCASTRRTLIINRLCNLQLYERRKKTKSRHRHLEV